VGEVTDFDPPNLVTYSFTEPPSFMRFELAPDRDGTQLRFTLAWAPGRRNEPEEYLGGDLPAGADTPWRPGFLAGFHGMLDDLGSFLDGTWAASDRLDEMAAGPSPFYERLVDVYREHVREHCPPA
jgi:hypothetical protein